MEFDYSDHGLTALTGKSEGHDGGDRLLLEAYRRLRAGEDPAEVERDILRRATGDG
jgi:predicted signal transduction protein with EAL and GGDEF domain